MKNILFVTFVVSVLTSCAQPITSWQQSGVSEEKWAEDRSQCNSWSRRQAEKDYEVRPESNTLDATDNGFRHFMRSYDTKRSQQSLMEQCLRRLGYTPTELTKE